MHIIINFLNTSDKHNILKTERGKKIHYKQRNKDEDDGRFLTSNSADSEVIFLKFCKKPFCQFVILYPTKISFKMVMQRVK